MLRSPHSILLESDSRACVVNLLREDEARQLCKDLSLPGRRPYDELRAANLNEGATSAVFWWAFFRLPAPADRESIEPRSISTVNPKYGLFDHQRTAVDAAISALGHAPRRVLLHMPTGAGKTRMAMTIVAEHLRRNEPTVVCWLANSEELCDQAADEFEKAWRTLGNRDVTLIPYWGSSSVALDEVRDGVLIGGFGKVYSSAITSLPWLANLGDRVSLIVVDEAHQVIAPTYQLIVDGLMGRHARCGLLGLTATPGRTWSDIDADRALADFFATSKIGLVVPGYDNPVEFLIADGYLARPVFRSLEYDSADISATELDKLASALEVPQSVLEALASDDLRNLIIVKEIEQLARRHNRILVFAATVQHADVIAAVLCSCGTDARAVSAKTPRITRAQTVSWYKQDSSEPRVLVNFGIFTAGFDAPRTSAALIARPTKSLVLYSQMVGRATRGPRAGGNPTAEIVTVVDTQLPGFGSMAEAFSNWEDVWKRP